MYENNTLLIVVTNSYYCRGNQLASSSEDGSVRLWDLRKKENTNILNPHMVDKVARPKFGKWIGAVDFTEDWLVRDQSLFYIHAFIKHLT